MGDLNNEEAVFELLMSQFKEELNLIYFGQSTLLSCLIAEAFCYAVEKRNLDIDKMPLKSMIRATIDYISRGQSPGNLSPLVDLAVTRYRAEAHSALVPKLSE